MQLKYLCIFAFYLTSIQTARQVRDEKEKFEKQNKQCDNKSDTSCSVYSYEESKKPDQNQEEDYKALFNQFKKKYDVKYRSIPEQTKRFEIFTQNYKVSKGFNQFLDITQQEFQKTYLGYRAPQKPDPKDCDQKEKKEDLPKNRILQTFEPIDWTKKDNIISPVKDQDICLSCWAFSASDAVESALAIAGKPHPLLSEQQLMVCRELLPNQIPCYIGGYPSQAFQQIVDKGITTNDTFPYSVNDDTCIQEGGDIKISNYTSYYSQEPDCDQLEAALAKQPISVCIDTRILKNSVNDGFSGIFNQCINDIQIDHCVLLVAADSESWTIKNSWGTKWGNNGYIKLTKGNSCGICQEFSYPIV